MDTNSSGIIPVMPMNSGADAFNGNSFMYLFGLLILLGMFNGGFGGFFGGNSFANAIGYENLATSNEVQRGFDNQNSMANQRDILAAVNAGTAQCVSATNQTFHDMLGALSDKYSELQRDVAGVALATQQGIANQNACCCDTKMLIQQTSANTDAQIAQNRYEAAMNTASINANTTAQTQKILDAISQNKIDELQAQVGNLQLQIATSNVLRYPNQWTYNGGFFPPIMPPMCNCQSI